MLTQFKYTILVYAHENTVVSSMGIGRDLFVLTVLKKKKNYL